MKSGPLGIRLSYVSAISSSVMLFFVLRPRVCQICYYAHNGAICEKNSTRGARPQQDVRTAFPTQIN